MSTQHSLIRTTGTALVAAVALTVYTGCSKKADTAAAPSQEATSAVSAPVASAPQSFTPPAAAPATDPATVIAVVNGDEITYGDFETEMAAVMGRMQGRVPPERLAQMRLQMRDQLLDNMITRQVLVDQIEAESIEVSEEEITEAIAEIIETLPPGMGLSDMLTQANTTEEDFRTTLTSELQIRKLIESHIGEASTPSDEEIQAFYEENNTQFERPETVSASHILIGTDPAETAEEKEAKRKQLEDIRVQLVEGGDFAELAAAHSSCPSKSQGGDLGAFPRGSMVPEFEEAAFTQEIDGIGEIVETQFGFHVIKVTERSDEGVTPFEEVKEQLSEYLANQNQQKGVQEFVATLREKADVTFPDGTAPSVN